MVQICNDLLHPAAQKVIRLHWYKYCIKSMKTVGLQLLDIGHCEGTPIMSTFQKALTLRTKKLGILITDARIASRRSMKECAMLLGISQQEFSLIELGEKTPSLPQLEFLAFYLDVPIEHFWGNKTISEDQDFKLE